MSVGLRVLGAWGKKAWKLSCEMGLRRWDV